MESDYLTAFLDRKKTPIIKKKRHTYLAYHGLEEAYTYVLKKGVVKTSIILKDGREFNLSYIVSPDIISLLRDEVSNYTSAPWYPIKASLFRLNADIKRSRCRI